VLSWTGRFLGSNCICNLLNIKKFSDLLPEFRTKLNMISAKERGISMSRSRHTEAQMIAALKQVEAGRAVEAAKNSTT
jgi:hypothetical protein